MSRYMFAIPVAIVLAMCGGLMIYGARLAKNPNVGIDFDQPVHPVTSQMEVETAAMANRLAPTIQTNDAYGKPVVSGTPGAPRPQFVLFIKEGCPCSIDAQPIFNDLSKKFAGAIDFIGVIDADSVKAKEYSTQFKMPFPVVPDASLHTISAYRAKGSVYSALLARNGHIIRMWPGYSVDILAAMNELMAKASGAKVTKFDAKWAPMKKTSGCAFDTL